MAIAEFCKQHRYEIEALLGIKILPGDSPIAIAQKLLGLIGYRLPRLRREGSGRDGSVRVYVYGAAAPSFERDCRGKLLLDDSGQARALPDGRDEVFAAWLLRDEALQATSEGVESDFASTGHNNNVYITPHGRNPMDATETMDATPLTPTERLLESLSRVESFGQFWEAIRGYGDETVEDAIALQDSHPHRQMLREWLKAEPLPQVDSFGELWRAIGEPSPSLGSEAVRYVAGFLKTCSHQGKAPIRCPMPLPLY